jgi:hypothetical protein
MENKMYDYLYYEDCEADYFEAIIELESYQEMIADVETPDDWLTDVP